MRILICGSRGWHDPGPITALIAGYDVLAEGRDEKLTIIHGDAPGADRLAKRIGKQWGAEVIDEPADWDQYGKAAGPIRNQKMLDEHKPDVIWAFRSYGKSSGTDDMVRRGEAAQIPTYVVNGGPR
jgi:hypothetical protein